MQLDNQQQGIQKMSKENAEAMKKVCIVVIQNSHLYLKLEESFAKNMQIIKNNVDALEKRFAELSKKMNSLWSSFVQDDVMF